MKRQLTTLILTAGFSAFLGSTVLSAQDSKEIAKVPFAFSVAGKTLPAGKYTVARYGESGVPLFQISSADGQSRFLNMPRQKKADPQRPKLTFACYGKECILAEISLPGNAEGYSLSQHAIEKNLTHGMGMASMISVRLAPR